MTRSFGWPPAGWSATRQHGDRLPPGPRGLGPLVRPARRAPARRERHHVDLWVRHLTTQRQPRTGRLAAPATVRSLALVSLLTFCGPRNSEALNAEVRDYGHDHGRRVLEVTHKGGKT